MTRARDWVRARDLVAGLPARLRRRLPRRPAARRRRAPAAPRSSTGSTTPSNSARRASRSARCSPPAPTATTPPTTTASTRASATTPTSTTWSPRRTGAGCGCCSTACSTTSAPISRSYRDAVDGDADDQHGFAASRGRFRHLRGARRADHAQPRQPRRRRLHRRRDDALAAAAAPTAGASTPPTRCPNGSGRRCCRGSASEHPDAWFVGEVIHGDYAGDRGRSRASTRSPSTNCGRRSGAASTTATSTSWTGPCSGTTSSSTPSCRMTFVGNHDVTRIASQLDEPRHLAHALVLLLTIGGVPERSTPATSSASAASRRSGSAATTPCGPSSALPQCLSTHAGADDLLPCTST